MITPNLPEFGLISFHSLSRTQKTVGPKILKIWDTLTHTPSKIVYILYLFFFGISEHLTIFRKKVGLNLAAIAGWNSILGIPMLYFFDGIFCEIMGLFPGNF